LTRSVRFAARIAVDLLGGDDAPAVVVDGVLSALRADPQLYVVLAGPEEAGELVLRALGEADRVRVSIVPASEVVAMEERPVHAVRTRPQATVRVAMETLPAGTADAVFTAGSTGATVAAAQFVLGLLPGVIRPALAVAIPSRRGPVILLDVGATPDPAARVMVSHALLGIAYARLRGIAGPRLGLLSTGREPGKGDGLRRKVAARLARADLRGGTYAGLVEGQHVPLGGPADVVLTDGFSGNILLKGMEGTAALSGGALASPGGALLLGVAGLVVVGHGSSGPGAVAAGIAVAADAVRDGMQAALERELAGHSPEPTGQSREVLP
jgi:glycerol-3-phosphate acyltransferase PlsX